MLHLYQSNRIEILGELLAAVLAEPLDAVLAPENIVVQNEGMGRWISLFVAKRLGICANMEFQLPAAFIWRVARNVLGDLPERSVFAPEILAWRLMGELGGIAERSVDGALAGYLDGAGDLARFELARKVADTFDHYLVYRPDWIAAWDDGRLLGLGPDEPWQCALWRKAARGDRHRVHLLERLLTDLKRLPARPSGLPSRVILFGISSMPPAYLAVLRELAQKIDICLFVLNPCAQPWGHIVDSREIARRAGDGAAEDLHLETGNALLASWGKQGRDFMDLVLEACDSELHSVFDDPGADSLLHALQSDILNLVDRGSEDARPMASPDPSVEVHVCHSPMREVEVLFDQLLSRFAARPDLEPSEVVVLVPDIETYAPYIDAVFQAQGGGARIPYGLADRRPSADDPLLSAFLGILDIPGSRFEAGRVLDILAAPAVLRRFELSEDDALLIHDWVRAAGIRWGRDSAHREALGLPGTGEHTWRSGIDRLLLGFALPQACAQGASPLYHGVLPFDAIEGDRARVLGQFVAFFETVLDAETWLTGAHPPGQWTVRLSHLLDRLFVPDEAEEETLARIRASLDDLMTDSALAGFGAPVSLAVIQAWLAGRLGQASGASGFLRGGVTFCSLVPMRVPPFRVVCVLGLNDDAFPRQTRPPGFDLMARDFRRGDRSRRHDDRHLFLETILSAREALYLSYVGASIRDNEPLPPSVLVSELLDAVRRGFRLEERGDAGARTVTHHPLQAFSPRYFLGEAGLFSYSASLGAASALVGHGTAKSEPLFPVPLPNPEPEWGSVELASLHEFFRNPVRFLLQRRLGLQLAEADGGFEAREPFGLDAFARMHARKTLLEELRQRGTMDGALALLRAEGVLPHGQWGAAFLDREREPVQALSVRLHGCLPERALDPLEVAFVAPHGVRLTGWLDRVGPGGIVDHRVADISPADRWGLWLRHLLLCHLKPEGVALSSRWVGLDGEFALAPVADPAPLIATILETYWRGLTRPVPFFVRASHAYATASRAGGPALKAAHAAWDVPEFRNGGTFGESEEAHYQFVYRGHDPLDDEFTALAARLFAPMLDHVIGDVA
ncbi:MAG: exodeoxyribonuclease V subunit gamma [Betaproteobacteria bacterium]|nr:exodeoxyribonuclease V subunit gamma [Betaproteobacteria bacterium]